MKRILSIALVLLLGLAGCSAPMEEITTEAPAKAPETDSVRLVMATSANWTGVLRGEVFEKCCDALEEWSGGKLTMDMYDAAKLGGDIELINGVKLGTLNIVNTVPAYQKEAVAEAALLDAPGIFSSVEQYNQMMDDGYLEIMQEYYRDAGLELLESYALSFRQLSSNKPVYTIEDFKNLRIRTMESPYQSLYWSSLGAVAMPLPYSEVYIALRQGTVDAQENPLYNLVSKRFYEVQKYLILTNHVPMVTNYVMNKEQYDALSEENKALLARFMSKLKEEDIQMMPQEDAKQLQQLQEEWGMEVIVPSNDLLEQMRSGNAELLDQLRADLGGEKVNDFLAAAEKARVEVSR